MDEIPKITHLTSVNLPDKVNEIIIKLNEIVAILNFHELNDIDDSFRKEDYTT